MGLGSTLALGGTPIANYCIGKTTNPKEDEMKIESMGTNETGMNSQIANGATFAMDEINEHFPDVIEKLEDIGENIFDHLKANRMTYLAVASGAVVLGGALFLLTSFKMSKPKIFKAAVRPTASRSKRKQSRIQ